MLESSPTSKLAKPSSVVPLEHEHTYFKRVSTEKGKQLKQVTEPSKVTFGDKVMLMQKGKSMGMGTVTEGLILHGRAIPHKYVKVTIDYIQLNTTPMFTSTFDDEDTQSWTIHSMATE